MRSVKKIKLGSSAIGILLWVLTSAVSTVLADEDCGVRWTATEASGVAVFHGFMMGTGTIVVDVRSWEAMTYGEKQAVLELFQCTFPPAGAKRFPVEFRSNMTNNLVGQWTEEGGLLVGER